MGSFGAVQAWRNRYLVVLDAACRRSATPSMLHYATSAASIFV
jgi:hypothetical protein